MRAEGRVIANIDNWNNAYKEQNFELMDDIYEQIRADLSKFMPLSDFLTEIGRIENLHNLIRNNGNNFNISEEERKLSEFLITPRYTSIHPKMFETIRGF